MTSWLRGSPLRSSLGRRTRAPSPIHDVDPAAAFHSFIKHWQQTIEIISRTRGQGQVVVDDVTAVINHLAQMVNLLLVDLQQIMAHGARVGPNGLGPNGNMETMKDITVRGGQHSSLPAEDPPHTPIFDHFLGEEILDTIFQWSCTTGEYMNALKLEQLKAHEQLLSYSRQEILVYKPILRPLLRLLASCSERAPVDVEKRLVVLLNQLCVSLMHNHQLLDFFFQSSEDQGPTKFLIFSLLLPFVHREGGICQQARDALLLCMALSSSHSDVGQYIAKHSDFCPVLATGLSGLYSTLPRTLIIESDGWHRLGQEDLADIPQLQMFINSLEFCNAVVQVAHPLVREQLVKYLYQGFLVPVLGPALHQDGAVELLGAEPVSPVLLNLVGELVAATAYLDLFLRTVTEPELLRAFLAFLLTQPEPNCKDPPLISILIARIHSSNVQLCLVTLNLFLTLVELNCEDVMLNLVFQYLTPCTHIMVSQRARLTQLPQGTSCKPADKFLSLIPAICQNQDGFSTPKQREMSTNLGSCVDAPTSTQVPTSPLIVPQHRRTLSSTSTCSSSEEDTGSYDVNSSFLDYLKEARARVAACNEACSCWVWQYDGQNPSPTQAVELLGNARATPTIIYPKPRSHSDPKSYTRSTSENGHNEKSNIADLPRQISGRTLCDKGNVLNTNCDTCDTIAEKKSIATSSVAEEGDKGVEEQVVVHGEEAMDSLGESSGYESFNIRVSRDSSPIHSGGASSEGQGSPSQHSLPDEKRPEEYEDDKEFMAILQRSKTPTELLDIEETFRELEQVFSAHKIFDVSTRDSHNKVYCIELPGEDDWDQQPWSDSSPCQSEVADPFSSASEPSSPVRPTIGPFLEALLQRVDQMLCTSIHINLLVTSILSRLALYPTPLLTSLLLDPALVFQPSVRSLLQVLSGQKQRIDSLVTEEDCGSLSEAKLWFTNRCIVTPQHSPRTVSTPSPIVESSLVRGETKRRSLSQTMSAFFRRNTTDRPIKESPLENLPDGSGYRYVKRDSLASMDSSVSGAVGSNSAGSSKNTGTSSQKRHYARCAVLMQHWLLEMAAIAQEHLVKSKEITYSFKS
ncbi:FHF complex subunit HOOK-interacting protein 1B-like isoform X2 [Oratosquilla oratoria]|uniref:FHF complex subunit HOOK-interacting protein 1B-like isoform X2 n=1 Tax=Oratosquilla oratoria TaxID=337810 RepID=UPI003F771B89